MFTSIIASAAIIKCGALLRLCMETAPLKQTASWHDPNTCTGLKTSENKDTLVQYFSEPECNQKQLIKGDAHETWYTLCLLFSKGSENVELSIWNVWSAVSAFWQQLTLLEHCVLWQTSTQVNGTVYRRKYHLFSVKGLRIHKVRLKIIHICAKNTSALGFMPVFNPSCLGQNNTSPSKSN